MRFMVIVKATKDSKAGKMPSGELSELPLFRGNNLKEYG
jgi:hypothetical protein